LQQRSTPQFLEVRTAPFISNHKLGVEHDIAG
jgi:hypothetical protein